MQEIRAPADKAFGNPHNKLRTGARSDPEGSRALDRSTVGIDVRRGEPVQCGWATTGPLTRAADHGNVSATLRLLDDCDVARIGRVATATSARGAGLAAELMRRAIARSTEKWPHREIHLDAQAHLASWYGRFGFEVSGSPFKEDGILHVPMTRAPGPVRGAI